MKKLFLFLILGIVSSCNNQDWMPKYAAFSGTNAAYTLPRGTNQILFTFSVTSTGGQTLSSLAYHFSTDIIGSFKNFELNDGAAAIGTYSVEEVPGEDIMSSVCTCACKKPGTIIYVESTKTLTFAGLKEFLTSTMTYTLKADVIPSAVPQSLTVSLSSADVSISNGTINHFSITNALTVSN
jgi:hypothetical protein